MAGLWKVYDVCVQEQILDLWFCRLYLCTATDDKRKIKMNGDFNNMKTAVKDPRVQSSFRDDEAGWVTFICCVCELVFTCLPLFLNISITLETFFLP